MINLMLALRGDTAGTSVLATVKTVADIVQAFITSLAVVIGAIWAYFKFVQGRTFRPRIEVDLSGQWRELGKRTVLHARIRVKNIGLSKITLMQKGTGLRASLLADNQPPPPSATAWEKQRVFVVLGSHKWIEPGETVSDELFIDLGVPSPEPVLIEARLVWHRRRKNIVVTAKEIVASDAVMPPIGLGGD